MTRSSQPKPVVIDFESFGLEGRPHYPPVPTGVSIKYPGKAAHYYAWGHVSGNNCSYGEAKSALAQAWEWPEGLLFQNGKFDVDVAEVHMDLPLPEWDRIHDTMFLLFLDDPHQKELGLKPSADRLLKMPAEERDAVQDWMLEHQPVRGVKISKSKSSDHYFMKYLPFAPGDLVGKYADGDDIRTEKLFNLLWTKTKKRGMLAAYDRERRLMPVLLEMERQGLPVDAQRLKADVALYTQWFDKVSDWITKHLKAPGINLNSGEELMAAMIAAGKVDEEKALLTPGGKYQTNKEALLVAVNDKVLLAMLKYRSQLATCLGTFMRPWLRVAEQSGGLIFTNWNQVKSPSGNDSVGARTGRLSSTPNFMNLPKEFTAIFAEEESDKAKAKKLPKCPLKGLPSLPQCRSYITPFAGEVFVDRDYSQQEPRILAHFDGGQLMETYNETPWTDFHDFAKAELELMGLFYERRPVKNTNLGLIYGMGVGKLAEKNGMDVKEAGELKKAILKLYPGLSDIYKEVKVRAKAGVPIRTWGGREYYCEPPKLIKGRMVTFDYKLVNVLIQGSGADCTKEALIRFNGERKRRGKLVWKIVLNVHDQITVSCPLVDMHECMEVLRIAMESVEFDVPMLSEGAVSTTNWGELIDYDEKGVQVWKEVA